MRGESWDTEGGREGERLEVERVTRQKESVEVGVAVHLLFMINLN